DIFDYDKSNFETYIMNYVYEPEFYLLLDYQVESSDFDENTRNEYVIENSIIETLLAEFHLNLVKLAKLRNLYLSINLLLKFLNKDLSLFIFINLWYIQFDLYFKYFFFKIFF